MPTFFIWLGEHPWAIWLVVALLLASAELLTLDLTLIMLASGALAGALVALVFPMWWPAQVIFAAFSAILMLALLRPTLLRKVRRIPGYRSSVDTLVGSIAIVLSEITYNSGEVKLNGDIWRARPLDSKMIIRVGRQVQVYEVDGITLVVYPYESSSTRKV